MNNEYVFAHLTIIILVAAMSGILLAKLNQPILIGYIAAGMMFGPSMLGFISSEQQIQFYSELGILLLLFVIGIELNIKAFLKMWRIPTLFTMIQVSVNAAIAFLFARVFSLPVPAALLGAFVVSLSSTAAIVKILEHIGEKNTDIGNISVGILVAQDIVVVPMMLILKKNNDTFNFATLIYVMVALGLVVFLMKYLVVKEKVNSPIGYFGKNPDLTPVIALAFCFSVAYLVVLIGLSEAYGAFLAGLFIGSTKERETILNSIKPIQNVLLMVFFLSVGLMFDLKFLFENWIKVFLLLAFFTTWKGVFNTVLLRLFSVELAKAATIGIVLSQIGEFSLILANVAIQSEIIDTYGQKLITCITTISLAMSPLFLAFSTRTKNLFLIGDNSPRSIMLVVISKRFAKNIKLLLKNSEKKQDANF